MLLLVVRLATRRNVGLVLSYHYDFVKISLRLLACTEGTSINYLHLHHKRDTRTKSFTFIFLSNDINVHLKMNPTFSLEITQRSVRKELNVQWENDLIRVDLPALRGSVLLEESGIRGSWQSTRLTRFPRSCSWIPWFHFWHIAGPPWEHPNL